MSTLGLPWSSPGAWGWALSTHPTINPQVWAQTAASGRAGIPSIPVPPLPPREHEKSLPTSSEPGMAHSTAHLPLCLQRGGDSAPTAPNAAQWPGCGHASSVTRLCHMQQGQQGGWHLPAGVSEGGRLGKSGKCRHAAVKEVVFSPTCTSPQENHSPQLPNQSSGVSACWTSAAEFHL